MALISETDLTNAKLDADDLADFMNGAAGGTVSTRTGGTFANLASLVTSMLAQVVGTKINKTSGGSVTVTTERFVYINKNTPAPTTVNLPAPETRVGELPITIKNVGFSVDYRNNPTTLSAPSGKFFSRTGTNTMVMNGAEQWVELRPLGSTYDVIGG